MQCKDQDKQNRDPVRKYVCGAIVIMAMRMFPSKTEGPLFGILRERIHKFVHGRYHAILCRLSAWKITILCSFHEIAYPTAIFPRAQLSEFIFYYRKITR